jgi:hypothetical protein
MPNTARSSARRSEAKRCGAFGVPVLRSDDVGTRCSLEKRSSGATSLELGAQLPPALPLGTPLIERG